MPEAGPAAAAALRVVAARSAPARRRQADGPLQRARSSRQRRSPAPLAPGRSRVPALGRRRPPSLRLRRAASRRGRPDGGARPRTGARQARRARARPTRGGDERQRLRLDEQPRLQGRPDSRRRTRHRHSAVHAALERQGRALDPDPAAGVGIRPHLGKLKRTRPSAPKLLPLLQPAQTTRLARRPATTQPRSQRLWVLQLGPEDLRLLRLELLVIDDPLLV